MQYKKDLEIYWSIILGLFMTQLFFKGMKYGSRMPLWIIDVIITCGLNYVRYVDCLSSKH